MADPEHAQPGASGLAGADAAAEAVRGATPPSRCHGTLSRRRRHFGSFAVVLAATLLGAAAWVLSKRAPAVATPRSYASVAVLPLEDRSRDPAQNEHLVDGVGEALATKLMLLDGLRVTPWSTSRRHRERTVPFTEVAGRLAVDSLLVGTCQRVGDRLRGSIHLIDARDGKRVWSEGFDESVVAVFELENRIAVRAAHRLVGALPIGQVEKLARPVAQNLDAYELCLRGSIALEHDGRASVEAALGYFERAVAADPRYARAHAGIGSVHLTRFVHSWAAAQEASASARASFDAALDLDPNLVAARRGLIRLHFERGEFEACLEHGRLLATSAGDDVEALSARAEAYLFGGLPRRSIPLLERVIDRDPDNAGATRHRVIAEHRSGRHVQAVEAGKAYLERFGEDAEVHHWMAEASRCLGQTQDAELHFSRALALLPEGTISYHLLGAASFFIETGRAQFVDPNLLDALEFVDQALLGNPDGSRQRVEAARLYSLLGDADGVREQEAAIRRLLPGDSRALGQLFEPYLRIGETDRAIELCRQAVKRLDLASCAPRSLERCAPDSERWRELQRRPAFRPLLREYEAAEKRLEALN